MIRYTKKHGYEWYIDTYSLLQHAGGEHCFIKCSRKNIKGVSVIWIHHGQSWLFKKSRWHYHILLTPKFMSAELHWLIESQACDDKVLVR